MAKRYGDVRAPSVRNVGSSLSGPFITPPHGLRIASTYGPTPEPRPRSVHVARCLFVCEVYSLLDHTND